MKKDSTRTGATLCSSMRPRSATTSWLNKFKLLALVLTTMLSVNQVWGEDEIYKTALFERTTFSANSQSYSGSFSSTYNGFTVDIENASNNNKQWDYIKMGHQSTKYTGEIYTASTIDEPITKVALTISGINSYVTSINLYSSKDVTWEDYTYEGSFTMATGTQVVEIENPQADLYYNIEIPCTTGGKSNGHITITRVDFYKASGSSSYTLYLPTTTYCTGDAQGSFTSNKGTATAGTGSYSGMTAYTGITAGTEVTLTALPSSGYTFTGWEEYILMDDEYNDVPVAGSDNTGTFAMPSSNCVIWTCAFEEAHVVTYTDLFSGQKVGTFSHPNSHLCKS